VTVLNEAQAQLYRKQKQSRTMFYMFSHIVSCPNALNFRKVLLNLSFGFFQKAGGSKWTGAAPVRRRDVSMQGSKPCADAYLQTHIHLTTSSLSSATCPKHGYKMADEQNIDSCIETRDSEIEQIWLGFHSTGPFPVTTHCVCVCHMLFRHFTWFVLLGNLACQIKSRT